jgi:hypothetical protein
LNAQDGNGVSAHNYKKGYDGKTTFYKFEGSISGGEMNRENFEKVAFN